ncbi:hypothetical protein [Tateyamaria sp. Alg231-49]|uniref:hypothetical protein n=1 Tax=Tateyamaria sp. Alg231-49 TaxID=1922219 RepID=UPI000D554F58|nr:hypothetical protein [Tateyamaria sp. Alg231-49]
MDGNYRAGYTIAKLMRLFGWVGVTISFLVGLGSLFGEDAYGALFAGIGLFNSLLLVGVGHVMEAVFDGASNTDRLVKLMVQKPVKLPVNASSKSSQPRNTAMADDNGNPQTPMEKQPPSTSEHDYVYKGYRIPGRGDEKFVIHGIEFHGLIHATNFLDGKLENGTPINLDKVD